MDVFSATGVFLTIMGSLMGAFVIWSQRHPQHFTRRFTAFESWFYLGLSCLFTVMGLCVLFDWERVAQVTLVIGCSTTSAVLAALGPRGARNVLARHGSPVRLLELSLAILTCECGATMLLSVALAMFVPLRPVQTLSTAEAAVIWTFLISGIAFVAGAFASVTLAVVLRVSHAPA